MTGGSLPLTRACERAHNQGRICAKIPHTQSDSSEEATSGRIASQHFQLGPDHRTSQAAQINDFHLSGTWESSTLEPGAGVNHQMMMPTPWVGRNQVWLPLLLFQSQRGSAMCSKAKGLIHYDHQQRVNAVASLSRVKTCNSPVDGKVDRV